MLNIAHDINTKVKELQVKNKRISESLLASSILAQAFAWQINCPMLFSPLCASAAMWALNSAVRCLLFPFIGLILGAFAPLRPAKVLTDGSPCFAGSLH
jgi:hypothetical protein